ncbi:MAG: hypothetical protein Aurels2KO_27470 [Aureliella sp.]
MIGNKQDASAAPHKVLDSEHFTNKQRWPIHTWQIDDEKINSAERFFRNGTNQQFIYDTTTVLQQLGCPTQT